MSVMSILVTMQNTRKYAFILCVTHILSNISNINTSSLLLFCCCCFLVVSLPILYKIKVYN